MKKFIALLFVVALLPVSVQAATLALDFNNDSAEVRFDAPVTGDEYGQALLGGRYLYNEDEETDLGTIEFKFVGDPGAVPGLKVGAGFIGYIGESHVSYDFSNIGIGLMAEYAPAQLQGLGFSVRGVYSPDIFSWQDSDGLFEFNTRVSYAITPKIKVYVGYQVIEGEIDGTNQDVDIDKDVRGGLQVHF